MLSVVVLKWEDEIIFIIMVPLPMIRKQIMPRLKQTARQLLRGVHGMTFFVQALRNPSIYKMLTFLKWLFLTMTVNKP